MGLVLLIGIVVLEKILPEKRNFATEVLERTCFSIFSLMLINQAIHGFNGLMKHILENKIIVFLGKISYGIYIYHNFVYNFYHTPASNFIQRVLIKLQIILPLITDNQAFELIYYFAITVAIASISWFLIEKPINKLKERFSY